MKIKLNVRVNLTTEGRLFTVWPKTHKFLPGLEFYTGHGSSTSEAVEDLFAKLPEEFTTKAFGKQTRLRGYDLYNALAVFEALGVVERCGKSGRMTLYRKLHQE